VSGASPGDGAAERAAEHPSPRARGGATVEFRHVSKRYGPATQGGLGAVNDLSLTVPPGELCVLVGPSGCGKTTTLRMVNRLVEPTEGQVLLDGRDVATVEPTALRRQIGYVIQQGGLFPHQTIGENVATVPRLLGWPPARIRARVDELLALVGLDPARMRERYPAQLSGGERQRVGVARGMAAEPPLLLMDEPFGAVDPIVRTRLQDEFLRLHRDLGTTVLFVTHDIDEAIKLGTRVAVFQVGGRVAQYAPPGELLARPANEFVAQFVGADRGLKRLALLRVGDAGLVDWPTARVGEPAGAAGTARARATAAGAQHLLVLDGEGRPRGWLPVAALAADGPINAPAVDKLVVLDTATTLRDALSLLLTSPLERGAVVDGDGRYVGVLTVEAVAAALRAATAGEPAPDAAAPAPAAPGVPP
jgi:osmoprotectant transport system ATP-binding protein